jgi:hypothetical protein
MDLIARVHDLRPIDQHGHHLKGHVILFGASFHVDLIRVKWVGAHGTRYQVCAANDDEDDLEGRLVHEVYAGMQAYYEGAYETIAVHGYAGEYVMFLYPFCE